MREHIQNNSKSEISLLSSELTTVVLSTRAKYVCYLSMAHFLIFASTDKYLMTLCKKQGLL